MTDQNKLELLSARIKILEAENALLSRQQEAYEDFVQAVLGMFSEKNMEAFNVWVANINKAINALPGESRDGLGGAK